MKCDKLKSFIVRYNGKFIRAYEESEVDSAIDELKMEHHRERDEYIDWVNKLQRENSELKAMVTTDNSAVIARLEDSLRKTQRALWMSRAERAYVTTLLWNVYCYQNNCLYFRDFMNEKCNPFRNLPKKTAMEWSDLWESIETKCRVKAEEYYK